MDEPTSTPTIAMFESFDLEELQILELAQGVALPEMGASSFKSCCCSSSSASSCCCC